MLLTTYDIDSFKIFPAVMLFIAVNSGLTGYTLGRSQREWQQGERFIPQFLPSDSSITALIGETVYLPCRVAGLGDKVVSWIRTRDLHILTSGIFTFTADSRFEVLHRPESNDWTLRIIKAQPRDEGKYECQINTDPKMSFAVLLSVRESNMGDSPYESLTPVRSFPQMGVPMLAAAEISGTKVQYVHLGSTITFTCTVVAPHSTTWKPRNVEWYHENRLVTTKASRGGIVLDTEKTDTKTTSRLTVAEVTESDSGRYTCKPTDSRNATVKLLVIQAEHTEAMQRDEHSAAQSSSQLTGAANMKLTHLVTWVMCITYQLLWCSKLVDMT